MKRLTTLLIVFIILGAGLFIWWKNGTGSVNPKDSKPQIFVVQKGAGVREIANSLKDQNLIRDPIVFFLQVKRLGVDKEIQAGDFRLNSSMTMNEVLDTLRLGILDIWVTIPEGLRATEINAILKEKIPTYQETWAVELEKNEGYLFPDTYLIPKDADISIIISMLKNNFTNKYSTLDTFATKLSQEDIVTLASMIEREAKHVEDRPLVSSVISNRLRIGMKLDIDATIQYALGYQTDQKRWWKKSLTNTDKLLNSPYNTYRVAGLPPTPISNPGLASLQAAVKPARTSYLYYITDRNGINRYAEDLEGHNNNIEKYGL
ncbi:MAG: endolytic transglycosylase MltG [Patescibacteria group bacterium]